MGYLKRKHEEPFPISFTPASSLPHSSLCPAQDPISLSSTSQHMSQPEELGGGHALWRRQPRRPATENRPEKASLVHWTPAESPAFDLAPPASTAIADVRICLSRPEGRLPCTKRATWLPARDFYAPPSASK